jgi:hypothetical protein
MLQMPTGLRVLAGFESAALHLMVLYGGMRGIAPLNQSDALNSILSRTEIVDCHLPHSIPSKIKYGSSKMNLLE